MKRRKCAVCFCARPLVSAQKLFFLRPHQLYLARKKTLHRLPTKSLVMFTYSQCCHRNPNKRNIPSFLYFESVLVNDQYFISTYQPSSIKYRSTFFFPLYQLYLAQKKPHRLSPSRDQSTARGSNFVYSEMFSHYDFVILSSNILCFHKQNSKQHHSQCTPSPANPAVSYKIKHSKY